MEYGLEIAPRDVNMEVESVRCKFCVTFGKESSSSSSSARKRKVSGTVKYFTKPFRKDNYTSHLKVHSEKFAKYNALSNEEKKNSLKSKKNLSIPLIHTSRLKERNMYYALMLILLRRLLAICFSIWMMLRNVQAKKKHCRCSRKAMIVKCTPLQFRICGNSD